MENAGVPSDVLRVVSYNVHGCVDAKRRIRPCKIADIIAGLDADIIALQEVDGKTRLAPSQNQADIIAKELNQNYVYAPTDKMGLRAFGLAVISRFEIVGSRFDWLPGLHTMLNLRRRGALQVTLKTAIGDIHLINTHLSVYKLERNIQVKDLLSSRWVGKLPREEPLILCGDFNAGPRSSAYGLLSSKLNDVQNALPAGIPPQPTFHARSPYRRIDHIFVSERFDPLSIEVRRDSASRMASDHLPLLASLARI
jgi:endonuclease/exonuclease/phosphatase family metal-dependent hydrolase